MAGLVLLSQVRLGCHLFLRLVTLQSENVVSYNNLDHRATGFLRYQFQFQCFCLLSNNFFIY